MFLRSTRVPRYISLAIGSGIWKVQFFIDPYDSGVFIVFVPIEWDFVLLTYEYIESSYLCAFTNRYQIAIYTLVFFINLEYTIYIPDRMQGGGL